MQGPYGSLISASVWQTTPADASATTHSPNYLMGYGSWEMPEPSEAAAAPAIPGSFDSDSVDIQDSLVKKLRRSEKRRAQNRKAQQVFRDRKRQELEQVKEALRQKEVSLKKLETAYRQLYLVLTTLQRSERRRPRSEPGLPPPRLLHSQSDSAVPDQIFFQEANAVPPPTLERFDSGASASSTSISMNSSSSSSQQSSLTRQSSMSDDSGIWSYKQDFYEPRGSW
ncbi:hypothetical protein LTR10_015428 [Elasticomyces elasticus]|uniref:BZIP domain-containing protein n=1 Tax=Exophiala sideris TaxID=1016849 RepID=A0ABR0J3S0_9EURO|nr:hypothetical protein LTR10_015428 [Elasticomyces elasticus]KAK5026980.1 hypothetical protein LTS07_007279 [Exophiala sideris]KAK5033984.1 hypothetical protein LTR13_006584 [Exophiala sideris]KAK5055742.1 hypothetical protein LTR69_008117 [Exophiala sideris]KAK5180926.1 hypothetical protein LTR44_006746 [Eurotiomycetes sp. CCFEE 6388]